MSTSIVTYIIDREFHFAEIVKEFAVINQLMKVEQNPKYHREGNVYIHTKKVCEELMKFNQWHGLSEEDKAVLFLSALFHDMGKLTCTKIEDNEIVSPKHAVKGAKEFRKLFYREYSEKFSISFQLRERIAQLIKYHGLPLFFMEREDMDFELIRAAESVDMKLLYLLSKADLLGRECDDKEELLNNVEFFKEYSKELGCYYSPKKFSSSYTRFLYFNKRNIWHGDKVFDTTSFQVIIMAGLPLAGKDTYIEENLKGMAVISLDNIRAEFNISPKDGSAKVAAIARERAKEFLRKKQSFVWNATNIVKDTRSSLCSLFSAYGARVRFIYIEAPYNELITRNKVRERVVSEKIINTMINRFDMLEAWEGYETDYYIQ
ncbi:MAG: AAA family ATPase [Bacillota bacterium]|nr:AAA family ATPase [Bacillota bacterium]